jgi:hypothetical protein
MATGKAEHATSRGVLRACKTGKAYLGRRWRYGTAATT